MYNDIGDTKTRLIIKPNNLGRKIRNIFSNIACCSFHSYASHQTVGTKVNAQVRA